MLDDFAVFILTHGRADNVITYKTLQRAGYTGRVYIVIDTEDEQAEQYYKNFGDKVIMFDKAAIAETFDEGDNFQDRRAIIYARNACFDIAEKLGIEYFMQLDDDYYNLCYKINGQFEYVNSDYSTTFINTDAIFDALLCFYKSIDCVTLAIGQGGDYIGGKNSSSWTSQNLRRKAMNSFICSTSRRFQFVGRVNEDVNTYTSIQNKGSLFLTFPLVAIQQKMSQIQDGGMSEMYLDSGTYIKSFYTVMYQPSSVTVGMMGETHRRLHHRIDWDCTVPAIIGEQWKK